MARDFYDVLGVSKDADQESIRRAYRARSRALHPDASPEPDVAAFSELADAYAVLSRPEARRLYDSLGWRRPVGSLDGAEVVATLEVDAYEASTGTTRRIEVGEERRAVEVPVPPGAHDLDRIPIAPDQVALLRIVPARDRLAVRAAALLGLVSTLAFLLFLLAR
ncbi:MAG TPA: DnaJ domain-containing protein [Gaiellaceae bacterium]|jgi:DnaJ-class molecular chaperone|nr:DnaJ domain-containing protein [Gaiellaceae bacterium]